MNLVALGIGAIIGAGIFVLTGQAAANYAGPAIVYSFILAGTACALAGLCYAEFAAMIPIAGLGLHVRLRHAGRAHRLDHRLGPDPRVPLRGLDRRGRLVGVRGLVPQGPRHQHPAAVHVGPYVHTAPPDAGLNVWRLFTEGWSSTGAVLNVPAMIIVALITILLIIGISESASFNNLIVIIKLTVVFLFIGFGIAYINRENWEPFIPRGDRPGQVRLGRGRARAPA